MDRSSLSWAICSEHLLPDRDGTVSAPERAGLGMAIAAEAVKEYAIDLEIRFGGTLFYRTPSID